MLLVVAAVHVTHRAHAIVGHDDHFVTALGTLLGKTDRRNKAWLTPKVLADFLLGSWAQLPGTGRLHQLGLIHVKIAADERQNVAVGSLVEEQYVFGLL